MKVLYCTKCKSLVRLTRKHMRSCECGEVRGQYCKDGEHALSSQNPATISLAIGSGSLKTAIKKMQQRQKDKPRSTRKDYKSISRLVAWVRPNTGAGNPRSHPLKPKTY
jgi:hypothetical protein